MSEEDKWITDNGDDLKKWNSAGIVGEISGNPYHCVTWNLSKCVYQKLSLASSSKNMKYSNSKLSFDIIPHIQWQILDRFGLVF